MYFITSILPVARLLLLMGVLFNTSHAKPFTTATTINSIQGRAPSMAKTINSDRIGVSAGGSVYKDGILPLTATHNVRDLQGIIWPMALPEEYQDSDGDSGSLVVKSKFTWYFIMGLIEIELPLDDSLSIYEQFAPFSAGPYKVKIDNTVYPESTYGNPRKGPALNFSKTYTVVFTPSSKPDGTFLSPASSCLELKGYKPSALDGEYWLKDPGGYGKVKTYCDMTNGGYTLVWSYSEATAYSDEYGTWNRPSLNIYGGGFQRLDNDKPQNVVMTQTGHINYNNYRLPLSMMQNIPANKAGQTANYRVRIAYNATNMNDSWAKQNYLNITNSKPGYDYIWPTIRPNDGETNWSDSNAIATAQGKVFGNDFIYSSSGIAFRGQAISNPNDRKYYYGGVWGVHWDIQHRIKLGSVPGIFPRENGVVNQYVFETSWINNLFGHHGEDEVNHLFGKCVDAGSRSGDDYNFDILGCNERNKVPHSFNGGQGRYLQWFVR